MVRCQLSGALRDGMRGGLAPPPFIWIAEVTLRYLQQLVFGLSGLLTGALRVTQPIRNGGRKLINEVSSPLIKKCVAFKGAFPKI